MEIFTIGFTQKSAEQFFELLKKNKVQLLLDVRLNNKSQLAGFAKGKDLPYFMRHICNAEYAHEPEFAPTDQILDDYKKKRILWEDYESLYRNLMVRRNAEKIWLKKYREPERRICLLCSEPTPECCHRRLLADYLIEYSEVTNIDKIIHL